MISKAGKGLTCKCGKTILISAILLPLVFARCKEENYPPEAKLEVSPIYGEAFDSEGLNDKTEVSTVEVKGRPFMEQSASLYNDVEIKYNATLSYVDKAELTHIAAPVNKNSKKAVNNLVFINNFKNPQINNEYNQAVTD